MDDIHLRLTYISNYYGNIVHIKTVGNVLLVKKGHLFAWYCKKGFSVEPFLILVILKRF